MPNATQTKAKNTKNDEFYTQFRDIEKEVNAYLEYNPNLFNNKTIFLPCDDPEWSNFTKFFAQNFVNFGLKKIISTSYAVDSKKYKVPYQPTLFETEASQFDKKKTRINGKIFILERETKGKGKIDINNIKWQYLEGDGDFRSEEIIKLRNEADLIITNPPFSLFREFMSWLIESKILFLVIGSMNAIIYKEIFPLIKENKIWLGNKTSSQQMFLEAPKEYTKQVMKSKPEGMWWRIIDGKPLIGIHTALWFTNIDHGRRHQSIPLMTMSDNIKFSKHKEIRGKQYLKYDNYDAIEVPFTDAIPSDYDGVMGVPISFLDKYSPEQFEILGATQRGCHDEVPDLRKYDDYWEVKQSGKETGSSGGKTNENPNLFGNDGKKNYFINKKGRIVQSVYQRIFIKHIRKNK